VWISEVTLLWQAARITAVLAAILAMLVLLPDAPEDLEELVIPSVVFDPLTAVLQLDRYFPIGTLLAIASVAITIRVGMVGVWIYSWISKHVFGGG
jgi:hypothetical protein